MTRPNVKPAALPYVGDDDLALLAVDLGSGYFPAGDLYDWYTRAIAEEGRQPVSKKRFGMAMAAARWHPEIRTVEPGKQARCWLITRPWVRRGEALLAAEKAAAEAEKA